MFHRDLWSAALTAWEALSAHYGPAMARAAAEEAGLPAGTYFGWFLPALGLDPEPISTQRLAAWAPYTSPALEESRLEASTQLGLLRRSDQGEYYLTEIGRATVQRIIAAAYRCMAALHPLPAADLDVLTGLLRRLVEACLAAPEPPAQFHLRLSRRTDPGAAAPVLAQIDQYLTDLNAYRNDCHLAAWLPHGVSGHAWEAFTLIWRGEAQTLDDLAIALSRRGYTRADYAIALGDLVARGWLAAEADAYRVTQTGQAVRQAAEDLTDCYFYRPWESLDAGELARLGDLLAELTRGLVLRE